MSFKTTLKETKLTSTITTTFQTNFDSLLFKTKTLETNKTTKKQKLIFCTEKSTAHQRRKRGSAQSVFQGERSQQTGCAGINFPSCLDKTYNPRSPTFPSTTSLFLFFFFFVNATKATAAEYLSFRLVLIVSIFFLGMMEKVHASFPLNACDERQKIKSLHDICTKIKGLDLKFVELFLAKII